MIKDNLLSVLKRAETACVRAGRPFSEVTFVAVTKNVEPARIQRALDAGVRNIGENRIQEALLKFEPVNRYAETNGFKLMWHMIGHLQTNKVKDAVAMFDLIHSVDSLHLAQKINKEAASIGKVQDILLEVKTSEEATKYGFLPEEVLKVLPEITVLKNIRIKGLMTIAPVVENPEDARSYFKQLKKLSHDLFITHDTSNITRIELSMGMTDDFEAAIEEGSTMIRTGRGIFADRKI